MTPFKFLDNLAYTNVHYSESSNLVYNFVWRCLKIPEINEIYFELGKLFEVEAFSNWKIHYILYIYSLNKFEYQML